MQMENFVIRSAADIAQLVEAYGFLPFFMNDIAGFSVEEHTARGLWFAGDADGPWEWKGPVIQLAGCAYGKFFRAKAGFVSAAWYPDFANYRRDGYDFDALYDDGLARFEDKTVYDILAAHESLLSKEIKVRGGFGKKGRKGFDSIITRLQMLGYVTTVDFEYQRDRSGKVYGWGVARYAVPERHFGAAFTDAVYARTPEESKARILAHLTACLPHATQAQLLKLIG